MSAQLPGGLGGALGGIGGTLAMDLKWTVLATFLGLELADVAEAIGKGELTTLADLPAFLERELEHAIQDGEEKFGAPLWELLIRAPAGLDPVAIDSGQAGNAARMVKRLLGFGLALPLLTAKLEGVLKGVLGDHAPAGLLKAINELPNEIGVNFFIGTVMERIFETAVATPLEEAIAEQTHPARFDFRVVKALLTKHHLTQEEAETYLGRIGYRPEDVAKILSLSESFLSVADLQALFLEGSLDALQVVDYLLQLGYSSEDASRLVELYLTKAETQGGQQLRATARAGFLEGKITEGRYRELLATVNTPKRSIDLEVESAQLVLEWGRQHLTAATIKTLHDQGHLNDRQAQLELTRMGFSETDAAALMDSWKVARTITHPPLGVARILGYELGGILTRLQAHALLIQSGLTPADADLLAANPASLGGVYAHQLTPATVLSALKEGVIGVEDAKDHLVQLNVAPAEIDLAIALTVHKAVRGGKPRAAHKTLTEPQVLEAFRLGLATSSWALAELVTLGYADADAAIILAIEATKEAGAVPAGWVPLS
jgi:hypothetical protein